MGNDKFEGEKAYLYFSCPADVSDPPGKPDVSDVTATTMTIQWTPPKSDGGTPIKGYIIEKRDTTSMRWLKVNTDLEKDIVFNVTSLVQGTSYEFRVSAENKAGLSKPSPPSDSWKAKPPYGKLFAFLYYIRTEYYVIKIKYLVWLYFVFPRE